MFFSKNKNEMENIKTLNLCDFSEFPGRDTRESGDFSGDEFRDEWLIPFIEEHKNISLNFDGCFAYSSDFLDAVFVGLMEKINKNECNISEENIRFLIEHMISEDNPSVKCEAIEYIEAGMSGTVNENKEK